MNILLILEGSEEKTLYDIFQNKGFSNKFVVRAENVEGSGNIAPYFQSEISNEYYDCIICVYDVDNKINEKDSPYNKVRSALKEVLLSDDRVDAVSVCTNPNVAQFFLLGADELSKVSLSSTSKTSNTTLLNKYWPKIGNKKSYTAAAWQLDIIKNSFLYGPYSIETLLVNAEELDLDYKQKNPASNLLPLFKALIDGDSDYFTKAIKAKEMEE